MLFWLEVLLLLATLAGITADCVQGFIQQGKRLPIEVNVPRMPKTWKQMMNTCSQNFNGKRVTSVHASLTETMKRSCGDGLVPVNFKVEIDDVPASGNRDSTKYELRMMDNMYPKLKEGVGALNLTSGLWHFVDVGHLFSCVVCDMSLRENLHEQTDWEDENNDLTTYTYLIRLVSLEVHSGNASISRREKRGFTDELTSLFKTTLFNNLDQDISFRSASLNAEGHLVLIFHCAAQYSPEEIDNNKYREMFEDANGVHQTPLLKKYDMHTENITECPQKEIVEQGNRTIILPKSESGTVHLSWDGINKVVSRHMCGYQKSQEKNVWLTATKWEVVWMPCTPEDQLANNAYYQNYFNGATKHKHNYQFVFIYVCVRFYSIVF